MMRKILFLLMLLWTSTSIASKEKEVLCDSLSCKFSALNLDSFDINNYKIFDSIAQTKRFFFIGEDHRYRKSNTLIQTQFLKYLHQKVGVRVLVFELGPSLGWTVNHYVQTGDTSYFSSFKDYNFLDYQAFYTQLYEFNKTLDSTQKIKVIGIDIERSLPSAAKYLSFLLPLNKKVPKEISMNIESLKGLVAYLDDKYADLAAPKLETSNNYNFNFNKPHFSSWSTLKHLIEDADSNEIFYKSYLGDKYDDFKEVINGVKAYFVWYDYAEENAYQEWVYREQYMYNRFIDYALKHPEEKFIGSFGRCHTSQNAQSEWCGLSYFESLATRINKSEELEKQNQVLSIGAYYPRMTPTTTDEYEKSDYLKTLIDFTKEDSVMTFEIHTDTSSLNNMKSKFHYIIVNKLNPDDEKKEEVLEREYGIGNYNPFRTHLDFGYGLFLYDISSLNNHLNKIQNGLGFSTRLPLYSFGVTFGDDGGCFSMIFNGGKEQKGDLANGGSISLSMMQFNILWAYDLFKTKYFDNYLGGGFSFGSYTLKESSVVGKGVFDNPLNSSITNPSSGFVFQNDMRVNMKFISLGFKVGYNFDLSRMKWIDENNNVLHGSPSTGMSGLYGNINISIFFRDNGEY